MSTIHEINGSLIKGLFTKCFYLDKKLCYQIVIQYDKGQILYRDFTEYEDYRTYHNRFIEAINNKDLVVANFYISDSSETTLAAV